MTLLWPVSNSLFLATVLLLNSLSVKTVLVRHIIIIRLNEIRPYVFADVLIIFYYNRNF